MDFNRSATCSKCREKYVVTFHIIRDAGGEVQCFPCPLLSNHRMGFPRLPCIWMWSSDWSSISKWSPSWHRIREGHLTLVDWQNDRGDNTEGKMGAQSLTGASKTMITWHAECSCLWRLPWNHSIVSPRALESQQHLAAVRKSDWHTMQSETLTHLKI